MAPEVLNSETYPSSDVWSAGVMCYQLLCGYLPFDDVQNKKSPSLSVVWKSILTEDLSFKGSAWKNVSNEAKDFVAMLLNRDQAARPSAKQALAHSWLQNSFHQGKARTLDDTVVQRIQVCILLRYLPCLYADCSNSFCRGLDKLISFKEPFWN